MFRDLFEERITHSQSGKITFHQIENKWAWLKSALLQTATNYDGDMIVTNQNYSYIHEGIMSRLFGISWAGTAKSIQRLDYRLDDRGTGNRCPAGARHFSLLHNIQTSSGIYPATYSMTTVSCKAGWRLKLTIHLHLMPKLRIRNIPPLPHTSSCSGA
jgi:hypothetical protein